MTFCKITCAAAFVIRQPFDRLRANVSGVQQRCGLEKSSQSSNYQGHGTPKTDDGTAIVPTYGNDIEREQAETRRVLRLVAPCFPPRHAAALPAMQATNMPADAAQLAFDAWSAEQER